MDTREMDFRKQREAMVERYKKAGFQLVKNVPQRLYALLDPGPDYADVSQTRKSS